jgi:hypothetical protein
MPLNINEHIPKAGGLDDFCDRLSSYVSIYDKDWVNRIQPITPKKMEYLKDLLLNTAKVSEIPAYYKIFLEHLGNNDDKLIFWDESGSVGRIFARNGELFSEKGEYVEQYHLLDYDCPLLIKVSNEEEEEEEAFHFAEYDWHDNFNGIPRLLKISCDDYTYMYDCLDLSMEEANVVGEDGGFISENFEKYIFQIVFRHYFWRYKPFPFIIGITQAGVHYNAALAELKISNMFEFVERFAKENSFAKIWFSDKANYIGAKEDMCFYIEIDNGYAIGFIAGADEASLLETAKIISEKMKTSLYVDGKKLYEDGKEL